MANVISVYGLNQYVKSILESDGVLRDIALKGEISGFVRHPASGHFYFQLKDDKASVKVVMFRQSAQRLRFVPENGMAVIIRGRVSLYERDGAFQVYADALFPDGVGAAQIAFEQLKQRLLDEGLFDEERKRSLPRWPDRVGLITSGSGAALQDILTISRRRWPLVRYLLYPVNVQGDRAEKDIAAALTALGGREDLDAIIVTRGGGSKEDLWVFNSEAIARAAAASSAPVISAVGHEIDYTILDFVADMRAPTPSAAAELVLPDGQAVADGLSDMGRLAQRLVRARREQAASALEKDTRGAALRLPALAYKTASDRFSRAERALAITARTAMDKRSSHLLYMEELIASLNPATVLKRGYALVRGERGLVQAGGQALPGSKIQVEMRDGTLGCLVETFTKKENGNG